MKKALHKRLIVAIAGWSVAILMFFPIFWMFLTGFKTEIEAVSTPPALVFQPTLENYLSVQQRADYIKFAVNSLTISLASTLLALMLGTPAAYAMVFYPSRRTKGTLLWVLSTRMLPPVGALVPVYLLSRDTGLLDTRLGLVIVHALTNLPVVIWMLYTFFKEVPREIVEAARMDGAGLKDELYHLLLPLSLPGLASTSLLAVILSWNEAFWSLNLTGPHAAPLPAFIASFSSPEGLFWAKLSAASSMAIAPVLVFGWMTQRHLVRGLTFGAVK